MEFLSLIYTKRVNRKDIHNLLTKNDEFNLYRRAPREDVFINLSKNITVISRSYKIEIMFENENIDDITFLINKLIILNDNKNVSIKLYNCEGKNNLMQLLPMQNCYFV